MIGDRIRAHWFRTRSPNPSRKLCFLNISNHSTKFMQWKETLERHFFVETRKTWQIAKHSQFTYLSDCIIGGFASGERNECVSTICACHWIHHEAQVPDRAALLKQRNKLIFVHVLGYLAAKHFAAIAGWSRFPVWWWTAVLSLTWNRNKSGSIVTAIN